MLCPQVYGASVSLFLNGLEEDNTAFDTHSLHGPLTDITTDSAVWIGQSSNGNSSSRQNPFLVKYCAVCRFFFLNYCACFFAFDITFWTTFIPPKAGPRFTHPRPRASAESMNLIIIGKVYGNRKGFHHRNMRKPDINLWRNSSGSKVTIWPPTNLLINETRRDLHKTDRQTRVQMNFLCTSAWIWQDRNTMRSVWIFF